MNYVRMHFLCARCRALITSSASPLPLPCFRVSCWVMSKWNPTLIFAHTSRASLWPLCVAQQPTWALSPAYASPLSRPSSRHEVFALIYSCNKIYIDSVPVSPHITVTIILIKAHVLCPFDKSLRIWMLLVGPGGGATINGPIRNQ